MAPRNRKRRDLFIFPTPFAIILVLVSVASLTYLWLCAQCETHEHEIEIMHQREAELAKEFLTEQYTLARLVYDALPGPEYLNIRDLITGFEPDVPQLTEDDWALLAGEVHSLINEKKRLLAEKERLEDLVKAGQDLVHGMLRRYESRVGTFTFKELFVSFFMGIVSSLSATGLVTALVRRRTMRREAEMEHDAAMDSSEDQL